MKAANAAADESRLIKVRVLDKEVQLRCRPEEEEELFQAVAYIDRSMSEARRRSATSSLEKIAIVTAINTAHALLHARSREGGQEETTARVARLNETLDALLADAALRPDGVIVATPNALHAAHAIACIEAGLPVLLEKPVAPSAAEAAPLVERAAALGARVLVGHHRAHSPLVQAARETVAAGTLGRLVTVTASATFVKPQHYFDEAPWRREPGGGPILLNLVHEVHNLRMLCGEIVAVQAFSSNAVRGHAVEDTVVATLAFASGALGTLTLSDTAASPRSWEQTSGENPAYAHVDDEDCYVLAGTHGSLAVPTMRLTRYAAGTERSWWKPFERTALAVERRDPIRLQVEHFGAVVRGEAIPRVTLADGVANLAVVEAIARAAETGATVEL